MTQIKKPVIGITSVQSFTQKPVVLANQSYVDLIRAFGGLPVLVMEDPEIIEHLDGLLIIGGQDIDPELYGAKQQVSYQAISGLSKRFCRPLDYAPNRQRDDFEIALYHSAKLRKIPVLGICRGLQLMNVAEGGTLYQELPESSQILHERGPDGHSHGHFINIDPHSKTYELMQTEHYVSSSLHHQGIDKLGRNLRASAWAEDGLIEMIEGTESDPWILAVQGHIEQTGSNYPLYNKIVQAFIDKSRLKSIL